MTEVLWHRLTLVEHLLDACVSDVTCYDECTLEVEASLDRILREDLTHLVHTLVEVDVYSWRHCWSLGWEEACRILLELLEEDTLRSDLSLDVTVCRAAYADSHWA